MANLQQLKDLTDPRLSGAKKKRRKRRKKPDGRAYENTRRAVFKIKKNIWN